MVELHNLTSARNEVCSYSGGGGGRRDGVFDANPLYSTLNHCWLTLEYSNYKVDVASHTV